MIEDSTVTPNDGIDNPLNRSANSISLAKLLKDVEKSYGYGEKVLSESKPLFRKTSAGFDAVAYALQKVKEREDEVKFRRVIYSSVFRKKSVFTSSIPIVYYLMRTCVIETDLRYWIGLT